MEIYIKMDDPSSTQKTESDKQQEDSPDFLQGDFLNVSDVFSAIRIRRNFSSNNEMDKFLLDYGFNFLPYFGGVLYVIYYFGTIIN